jgi:hypothetical protein
MTHKIRKWHTYSEHCNLYQEAGQWLSKGTELYTIMKQPEKQWMTEHYQ